MLTAKDLLTLDEDEIRARLLWIEELDGVSDGEKLESLKRVSHVLLAIMLTVAGRLGVPAASG